MISTMMFKNLFILSCLLTFCCCIEVITKFDDIKMQSDDSLNRYGNPKIIASRNIDNSIKKVDEIELTETIEIAVEYPFKASNTTLNVSCSKVAERCATTHDCCKPFLCLTYAGKCVYPSETNLQLINKTDAAASNNQVSTELPSTPSNSTLSCSKVAERCATTHDCCKPFLCLTYAAKCVYPSEANLQLINKTDSAATSNQVSTELPSTPSNSTLSCSKVAERCTTTHDCCKPFLCLTYAAKCVYPSEANLQLINKTDSAATSNQVSTELPSTPSNTTLSCSKVAERCATTHDCCKPFLCLTYAAKCVYPSEGNLQLINKTDSAATSNQVSTELP